jgi:hypothetical protein
MINVRALAASIRGEIKRVGGCPYCIKQSLKLAVLGSAVFLGELAIPQLPHSPTVIWITGSIAAAFVCLWLLHVVVYGFKAARYAKQLPALDERRRFLATFAKASAGVAMIATLSLLPKRAYAQQTCSDGTECNPGTFCCYWSNDVWCCQDGTRCSSSNTCLPN